MIMASVFTRRIIAYVLDFIVVSAIMWIFSYVVYMLLGPNSYSVYKYYIYALPVFIVLYFTLCEKMAGASVGKAIMYLQVRSRNGARISWIQAILRNITKIYWVPIIFDWLIGKLLRSDRLFGAISKTVVINDY